MSSEEETKIQQKGFVDPKYPRKEFLKVFLISIIFIGLQGLWIHPMLWGMSLDFEEGPFPLSVYYYLWGSILACCLLIAILRYWYAKAFTKRFNYEITEQFLLIHKGVFTREKITIPFSRIQNITVDQGIIERIYGIYTVKVETAGASGPQAQGFAEGVITGIRNPTPLEQIIKRLVHGYTQAPYVPEKVKGKIFEDPNIAFDEFMAYFLSKLVEGTPMKTRIKELREKINLSQGELADKLGVARQTINVIENGKVIPSLPVAYRLAKIFGISIEQLFDLEELKD